MRIYISGKISGTNIEKTKQKFKHVQEYYERLGHEVVNPFELETDLTKDWAHYMRIDIKAMMECDTIFVMNDYIESEGARLEYHIACMLGFRILRQWGM